MTPTYVTLNPQCDVTGYKNGSIKVDLGSRINNLYLHTQGQSIVPVTHPNQQEVNKQQQNVSGLRGIELLMLECGLPPSTIGVINASNSPVLRHLDLDLEHSASAAGPD